MQSVKEITSKFADIDRLIIEILRCAAEDFLGLNANFREIYSKSTFISSNAEEMFSVYAESYTNDALQDLQIMFRQLSTAKRESEKHTSHVVKVFDEIYELLHSIDLHNKNINQNLLTLKFLLANLKITGIGSENEPDNGQNDQIFIEFNKLVNKSKLQELELAKTLHGNMQTVREGSDKIRKIMRQIDQQINLSLEIINEAIVMFSEKQQEHRLNLPKLQEQNGKLRNSIDQIITNLQYHDIIRQKIEHVQVSHKELLNNLSNEVSPEQQQYLARVGEVVNIQSALLVRANKEYQKAIEQIIDRFKVIGSVTSTILAQCRDLKKLQDIGSEQNDSELSRKLSDITLPMSKYLTLLARVNNIMQTCMHNMSRMVDVSNLDGETQRFSQLLIERVKQPSLKLQSNLIQQIETVGNDIVQSRNNMQTLYLQLSEKCKEVDKLSGLVSGIGKSEEWEAVPDKVSKILDNLKLCDEKISALLHKNYDASNQMGDIVNRAISEVKYYDVFEVKIIEIIKQLNLIYAMLSGKDETQMEKDDLEFLRSLYTMESEHQIHNMVIKGFHAADHIDESEQDENEIEFF